MTTSVFDKIAARISESARLTDADVEALVSSYDLVSIGMLADEARRRRHGNRATFVRVVSVPLNDAADAHWPPAAGEIRLTGAPQSFETGLERVRQVIATAGNIPVSAFSLADLERLAVNAGTSLSVLLRTLRDAGLELLADAPIDRLEDVETALRAAGDAGFVVTRVTVADPLNEGAVALFRRLAAMQDAVGQVRAFAPLPRSFSSSHPSTGYEDVKQVALARLLVDNTESIQVDWALYGPKLAQVALTFGADDVDAVSAEEDAGQGRRRKPLEEIRRNIRGAALTAVERNGRFEPLDR